MHMLTYAGDMTGAEHFEEVKPGVLFGWDPTGRPYEILDIEVYVEVKNDPLYTGACDMDGRTDTHTHIHLVYARPETLKEQLQGYAIFNTARGLL